MITWQNVDQQQFHLARRRPGNQAGRRRLYVREVGAFDIETTTFFTREILDAHADRTEVHFTPHSVLYVWMYAIDDNVYYGRTWDEFKEFIVHLEQRIPPGARLVTFIHNASYEYVFLSGIHEFTNEDLFPIDPRKILKMDLSEKIEMRCSYLLSNRDLRSFLKSEGVAAQKGEMNYKKKRFPWTPLSAEELSYCENDVLGLTQAIRHRLQATGDSIYTLPYTSTGYVRRDAKIALRSGRRHDGYRYDSYSVYVHLRRAFRGGNTHTSRYHAALGPITDELSFSDDFSSFYPSEICGGEFPAGPFFEEHPGAWEGRDEEYLNELLSEHRAVLFTVILRGVYCSEAQHVPYIPLDKCNEIHNAAIDNGRVLRADALEITLTDPDWGVIKSMYTYESFEMVYCAYTSYAPLPESYVTLTREYFRRKTELKNVNDYEYQRSKSLLNALFGLMAMDPLRMVIELDEDRVLYERKPDDMREAYDKACKKMIMPYSWGVWLTASCRAKLQRAIDACGDEFLYCDTDSVKHLCDLPILREMFEGDAYVAYDPAGNPHRMGVMERDAVYSEFVSLGAKKYAARYAEGKKAGELEITVAGVNKEEGSKELEAAGGITAFKPGFVFRSGGVDAYYNDYDCFSYIVDGHHLEVTRNVALVEGFYTLGLSKSYKELLETLREAREIINPFEDLEAQEDDLPLD